MVDDLKQVKDHDDGEEVIGGQRKARAGGFFGSVNAWLHSVLQRIAAAEHVVFTKSNIGLLREIVRSLPGEGVLVGMLLLALDQLERNLPSDPNADLTVEALSK